MFNTNVSQKIPYFPETSEQSEFYNRNKDDLLKKSSLAPAHSKKLVTHQDLYQQC